jgi:16S rRNA (guanine527-N7)-methyltransferase
VLHGRAEDLARLQQYREAFPLVVSRAVAPMNTLAELCLPFVAYKGPEGKKEAEKARQALAVLGCKNYHIFAYRLPEKMGERMLLLLKKEEATPEKYPRKAGLPAKKPL